MSERAAAPGGDDKSGVVFSLLSTAIISLAPVINKFALANIAVEQASFLNTLFVVVLAWVYMKLRGVPIKFVSTTGMWMTGIFEAAGTIFLYLSLGLLSPLVFGFINRFAVVFAVLLSVVFLKERITRREFYLIAAAVLGTFLFVGRGGDLSSIAGVLLALAYNFFFAVSNLFAKVSMRHTGSANIVFFSKAISLLVIGAYALAVGTQRRMDLHPAEAGLLALSALANYLGLLLAYEGFARLGYAKSSIIRSISPLLVTIYSWPFFPIELSATNVLGAAILFVSVALLTLSESRKAAAPSPEEAARPPQTMTYARIREILASHRPSDDKERADVAHIAALLETHDRLLWRDCPTAHMTGSAVVMTADRSQVLLVFHRKLEKWMQPGGHGANEPDPAQTALREAVEETGLADLDFFPPSGTPAPLDIDVHVIPPHGDDPAHEHLDFRYLLVTHTPDALRPATAELGDVRWLTLEAAMDLPLDAALRRLLAKAAALGRQP